MGVMKSKTRPNDLIICEYENKDINKPIKIIRGCKENEKEIKKLKIYYVKKFNEGSKRIPIYKKKIIFPDEKIKIIIKNEESITNIQKLFKGCKNLKRVNFDNFDFSNIKTEDVKGLFYNCDNVEHPERKKYENDDLQFDDSDIYGPNSKDSEDEEEKKEEGINVVDIGDLYDDNNNEDILRRNEIVRIRMSNLRELN